MRKMILDDPAQAKAAAKNRKPEPVPVQRNLGTQIVVLDRGFVYVGKAVIEGDFVTINNARNLRRWGTTKGLGELVDGPTSNTQLDQVGVVVAPVRAVIHFIKCNKDW